MAVSRDIYKSDVDFTALALHYPDFAKKVKPNRQLDFSDPESVRQLTKSLLHRDFNITIDLPEDRLCPPVPNRFNYILWLQDLLDTTSDGYRDRYDPAREVVGLDIGTGASCIYPLLACRQRPNWDLIATEIDAKSLAYAQRNVKANGLESRIRVFHSEAPDAPLLPPRVLKNVNSTIDFTMMNPPFYASEAEMLASATAKQRPPNSACTGAAVEMICAGGEVGFVTRLVEESALEPASGKVQWFTTMLGKLASVGEVVEVLRRKGCGNWAVAEFVQGQKTRRWAVGWSWGTRRPAVRVARGVDGMGVEKRWLPFPSEFAFELGRGEVGLEEVGARVDREVKALELRWQWKGAVAQGLGMADRDVWSRRARRTRTRTRKEKDGDEKRAEMDEDDNGDDEEGEEAALVFKISLSLSQVQGASGVVVNVRWLQGKDTVLFESFCGWLRRKVES